MDILTLSTHIKRLRRIAHLGLTYAKDEYDQERYAELHQISMELLSMISDEPLQKIKMYFSSKTEYITPKVDIRSVIFNNEGKILLVREKADGLWSLPGGWADIGNSPKETAEKEALEETGIRVRANKLLAVLDKRCHPHPPAPDYVYKIFIQCEILENTGYHAFDILDSGFFDRSALPDLSVDRVLPGHIALMFQFYDEPGKQAVFD